LVVKVYPTDYDRDLAVGFVDWNPYVLLWISFLTLKTYVVHFPTRSIFLLFYVVNTLFVALLQTTVLESGETSNSIAQDQCASRNFS